MLKHRMKDGPFQTIEGSDSDLKSPDIRSFSRF
jgi:hypothetical protein